ncbi:MAG: thioesterase family protein [Acidimicrobiia bacterium]|nr:thioesterase family protein [Acidimicrobiia bacterium]
MSFSAATSVRPVGNGTWEAEIEPGWDIFGIANGGYLLAMAARAMDNEAPDRHLVSISAHFLNPGRPGPVTIDVERLKEGRGFTTLRADMRSAERPLLTALASFANPDRELSEATLMHGAAPDLPPRSDCIRAVHSPPDLFPPPFVDKVELLFHPKDAANLRLHQASSARVRGWMRLLDGEQADAMALVMAADGFPPAIFTTSLPMNWTPTLDLTVHIRNSEPAEWLKMESKTRFVTGGLLEEDVEIWSESGDLLAHSRQLALVPS